MSSEGRTRDRLRFSVRWLATPAAFGLMAIIVALGWLEMAPADGYDFRPMYQAGWSVLNGTPVYDVPMFGYPPFAALFFVPFALFEWTSANHAYAVVQLVVAIAGGAVLGAGLFRRH